MSDPAESQIEAVREEGRVAADAGEQFEENPYWKSDGWQYITWVDGFQERRVTSPDCPRCKGAGMLTLQSEDGTSIYDGSKIRCTCNLPLEKRDQ